MKKYIACVEGLGEALFVVNIVRHAFSNVNAKIVTFTNGGGGRIPRYAMDRHEAFTRDATSKEFDFLFQIVNCGSDTQVMSYYLEISQNENFDFDYVFLLRDVYPDVS
ncbi:MAG: hypothetical protein MI743_19245, partial [Sneathiellales bacterium]|nr:hypothetical protein [Sneathiellales bacterium]